MTARLLIHPPLVNVIVLPSLVLVGWVWSRPRVVGSDMSNRLRRIVSVLSLLLVTISLCVYFSLPILADAIQSGYSDGDSDEVYRFGILTGLALALVGALLACFRLKGRRVALITAGLMLAGVWFFVGVLV
jgi:hypothetical protein